MKRILLIEDEKTISQMYKTKLELSGYVISIAENGLIALRILEKEDFDLILLDLRMPVMDGEKFLEKLRKNKEHKDVPVIVLTNISREEAPRTLWHHGISGYFVKAHNTPSDLDSLVSKHLQ